jgi:hypothetical protein
MENTRCDLHVACRWAHCSKSSRAQGATEHDLSSTHMYPSDHNRDTNTCLTAEMQEIPSSGIEATMG